ncbi:MAG: hypothetical protein DRJ61_17320 [Acidobacteria bacterium]|nr:MAG: hypothetical protein DRJ61_17320 [Acidobacteriota bacterium]
MKTRNHCLLAAVSIAVVLLSCATLEAATQSLMIPAASFSADGTDQYEYYNYGDFLETNVTLHFHAGVKLPNAARITNVDMMTLDDDSGTITMYLKRTKFGFDTGHETLLTFTSPGNIGCTTQGLCHDMEGSLDIKVDASNFNYWFDLVVPDDTGSGTDLRFYAVRIMYEVDDLIFADTFESTFTDMWDSDSAAKAATVDDGGAASADPADGLTTDERYEEFLSHLYVEDPLAHEALEKALKGVEGYGSPLVIPGPAFRSPGYTEFDDYYFSESYGFIYGRPAGEDGAVMTAGLNLPNGAEIAFFMAFYVDSRRDAYIDGNIRFWLERMDAADIIPTLTMVYTQTSGVDDDIRALSVNQSTMEAVEPGCTTINNDQYTYWLTIDVGPYDLSPPDPYADEEWWHKVYSIVILYTMP